MMLRCRWQALPASLQTELEPLAAHCPQPMAADDGLSLLRLCEMRQSAASSVEQATLGGR
jgi:hypothetical protein